MTDYEKATSFRKEKKYESAIEIYEADWKSNNNSTSLAGILNCLRAMKDKKSIDKGLDTIELIINEEKFVDWCENEVSYYLATIVLKKDSDFKDFDRLNNIFSVIINKFKEKKTISYIASKMSNFYSDNDQFKVVKRLRRYVDLDHLDNDIKKEWTDKVTYLYRLYKCFLKNKDFSIDFDVLVETVKINPKSELHLMRLYAQYLHEQELDEEALIVYQPLERFNKDYIMNEIGDIYYHKKEFDVAVKYFIKSVLSAKYYDKKYSVLKRIANCFLVIGMDESAFYTYALLLKFNRFHQATVHDADLNITYCKLKDKFNFNELSYQQINREFRKRIQDYVGYGEKKRGLVYSGIIKSLIKDFGFIRSADIDKDIYFKVDGMILEVGDTLKFEIKQFEDKNTKDIKYTAKNISIMKGRKR